MPSDEPPDEPRPPFARDYPPDPELDALVAAFQAGDFARVREGVPRLLASASGEDVKRAAASLLGRTRPDPLAALLLALTAALLLVLSAWWMAHNGGPR